MSTLLSVELGIHELRKVGMVPYGILMSPGTWKQLENLAKAHLVFAGLDKRAPWDQPAISRLYGLAIKTDLMHADNTVWVTNEETFNAMPGNIQGNPKPEMKTNALENCLDLISPSQHPKLRAEAADELVNLRSKIEELETEANKNTAELISALGANKDLLAKVAKLTEDLQDVTHERNCYKEWREAMLKEPIFNLSKAVAKLTKELDEARRVVGFFSSVIKSGDDWSQECEDALNSALASQEPSPAVLESWKGCHAELTKYLPKPSQERPRAHAISCPARVPWRTDQPKPICDCGLTSGPAEKEK